MTMSGNSLRFAIVEGEMVHGELTTPKANVYFNGELVAVVSTGLTDFHDGNPEFDARQPCPTLSVRALFHSVEVDKC